MKQINLAKGICSTSYLSKIESNTTIPSEDILSELLKRLKLEIKLTNEDENKTMVTFYEFYKSSILEREPESITEFLDKISIQPIIFLELKNYCFFNLYLFRLMLILKDEPTQLKNIYSLIIDMQDNFDERQQFLFNLNIGLYHYHKYEYLDALKHLENSLKLINRTNVEEWEIADYHNVLSLAYLKTIDYFNAIKYATKNLLYYQENLLYKRAIDSYIVIGLSYKNMKKYEEAEKNYNMGLKLSSDYSPFEYEGIIYQNIGSLYAIQDNRDKAIEFYKKSLIKKERTDMSEGYLITVLSIVKEYSKHNNREQVLKWCGIGLERISKDNEQVNISKRSYYHHFKIYTYLHGSSEDLIEELQRSIKHFEKIGDYRHEQKYSIFLANKYFEDNKLAAACQFYQKSNNVLLKQKTITDWEDL